MHDHTDTETTHVEAAVTAILEIRDYDQLMAINSVLRTRAAALRGQKIHDIKNEVHIGDAVRLKGLTPKYVNGYIVEIVEKHVSKLSVRLIDSKAPLRVRERLYGVFKVPAICVEPV